MYTDSQMTGYNSEVEAFQSTEYPMLQGKTYLDHGGTTLYAKSLIENVATNLISNLYGNPHSASSPAKLSGQVVDKTRIKTLRFFGADPEHFDLVFVANATAALKLVMEAFKDLGNSNKSEEDPEGGFNYYYHADSHNSVVGIREAAGDNHRCFRSDAEVESWLSQSSGHNYVSRVGLFAYPGQSNMNGRRLPLSWPGRLRRSNCSSHQDTYSLFDAAALATSFPLDVIFKRPDSAPDFTAVSFYKIFGYPDLGGLIVRKKSGHILKWGRRYFGGGTVDAVTVLGDRPFHHTREAIHGSLEDGTLPFHDIVSLSVAIDTHERLYGCNPIATISRHTNFLGKYLYESMASLIHLTGVPVCIIYKGLESTYGDSTTQGATIAFNILRADGSYVPYTSGVESAANDRRIYLRAGQLCNPGGIATHLGVSEWQVKRLIGSGYRCGAAQATGTEIMGGRPTGVVRVSLGAMTTIQNVDTFIDFLRDEFMTSEPATDEIATRSCNDYLPVPEESRAYIQRSQEFISCPVSPHETHKSSLGSYRPTPSLTATVTTRSVSQPSIQAPPRPYIYHEDRTFSMGTKPSTPLTYQNRSQNTLVASDRRSESRSEVVHSDFGGILNLQLGEVESPIIVENEKSGLRKFWKGRTRKMSGASIVD